MILKLNERAVFRLVMMRKIPWEQNCGLLLTFQFHYQQKTQDISHLIHLFRCAPLKRRAQQLDAATLTKTKDFAFTLRDYISFV